MACNLKVSNKGNDAPGNESGDRCNRRQNTNFEREGENLHYDLYISFGSGS
jgi:molecular chaperone DnaJ